MRVKDVLTIYCLVFMLTPKPPNTYTFIIDTIGTFNSVVAHSIILKYLWKSMNTHLTVTQPFSMVIITTLLFYTVKEYMVSLLGNCFNSLLQALVDFNPLLACGFVNNRFVFNAVIVSGTILDSSKLLLLLKPMLYHGANHGLVVKISMGLFGALMLADTVIFFAFGSLYYCHDTTFLRFGRIYNLELDVELLKSQHLTELFNIPGALFIIAILILELLVCIRTCKTGPESISSMIKSQMNALYKKVCGLTTEILQITPFPMYRIDMVELDMNQTVEDAEAQAEDVFINLDLNTKITQLKSAILNMPCQAPINDFTNKHYLLHCCYMFVSILVFIVTLRYLINNGHDQYDVALMGYLTYSRFLKFALPIFWIFYNDNIRFYIFTKVKRLMENQL